MSIRPDPSALATDVADAVLTLIVGVQSDGRRPQICLTGGTIAKTVYQAIAASPAVDTVDWSQVEFWWGDERYVEANAEERNDVLAHRAFLDAVGADPALVHAMPAADGEFASLSEAAAAYGALVTERIPDGFDLVLLGMGPDGHIASLFPGHPQIEVTDADAVWINNSPKPPPQRISLTRPALGRSDQVWLIVSGREKAAAAAAAINAVAPLLPAARVQGRTQTRWWLDADAASDL